MPAKKSTGPRDLSEAFLQLSEDLVHQASTPNIFGYEPHFKQVQFHTFGYMQPDKRFRPCRVDDLVTGFDNPFKAELKEELKKIRLYIGGNRSGKTVGGIIEDIWWVTKTHPFIDIGHIWPEPIRGRICSVDFKSGHEKIIIPTILRWCPRSYMRGGSWLTAYDKETHTIHFEGGGFIELMSYDQELEKFAGTSRHFIHFDEEPPEDIYVECVARTIDVGGCIWLTMTPVEGMTWTFDRLYEPGTLDGGTTDEKLGVKLTIQVVEVDMYDNPFVSDEEKAVFVSLLDSDEIQARVHGQFVRRGGLVYKEFDEKIHVIEPQIPSPEYLWVASCDHGYRNPTAWLWHAVNYEGRVITFREHYGAGLVIAEHAKIVHEINKENGRPPDFYIGDPSMKNKNAVTGTSVMDEYIRYGIPILEGNNDVVGGINKTASYLKPQPDEHKNMVPMWHITENCKMFIWEMKRYRWATWVHKRTEQDHNVKEEPVKKDDHAMDSSRYFIMSRPDLRPDNMDVVVDHSQLAKMINAAPTKSWDSEEGLTAKDFEPHESSFQPEYATNQYGSFVVDEYVGGEW